MEVRFFREGFYEAYSSSARVPALSTGEDERFAGCYMAVSIGVGQRLSNRPGAEK